MRNGGESARRSGGKEKKRKMGKTQCQGFWLAFLSHRTSHVFKRQFQPCQVFDLHASILIGKMENTAVDSLAQISPHRCVRSSPFKRPRSPRYCCFFVDITADPRLCSCWQLFHLSSPRQFLSSSERMKEEEEAEETEIPCWLRTECTFSSFLPYFLFLFAWR